MSSSSRLSSYARLAGVSTAAGGSLVTGLTVTMVSGHASADLQIWTVGQALPQISSDDPASMDLQVTATFNAAFKINFFGTGSDHDDQVFWAPNNNLSFINSTGSSECNDPAIWRQSVLIGASALDGMASNNGQTYHKWYQATDSHTTSNDIHKQIFAGETGAFGIRFIDGGDYYYGWVEVSEDADGIITVERWALESTANTAASYAPGGGGAVPGLGGLAALAMGAGGVRRKRNRVA